MRCSAPPVPLEGRPPPAPWPCVSRRRVCQRRAAIRSVLTHRRPGSAVPASRASSRFLCERYEPTTDNLRCSRLDGFRISVPGREPAPLHSKSPARERKGLCDRPAVSFGLDEPIADADFGQQVTRARRLLFDLAPQPRHENTSILLLLGAFRAPHLGE